MFALTLLGALAATAAEGATSVGAIAGSGGVGATGAATYSIPISIGPGTNGVQPALALSYSSQSGEGLAGYGWTLSGLSVIERCPWSIDSGDGQTRAVQLIGPGSQSDDFCLNGQHLLLKGGATYGANGATYQLQIEDFSTIVSHGSAGNGPSYFTVQGKDGMLYEYGNTTDSKILATGSTTARAWALDSVTDLNGNYYTVSYQNNDTTTGDYWPLSIAYTGNAGTSTSPLHTVTFSWTPRSDNTIQASFVAGTLVTQTQLLSGITVAYNGATTFAYTLSYQTDPQNSRNQLASVLECDGSGDCLPATTIQWQNGGAGWTPDVNTGVSVSDATHATAAHLMDVDGDGIMDLVYPDTGTGNWAVMFGQPGGGFTAPYNTGDPLWAGANYYQFALAAQYDGSGRESLLVPIPSGYQVLIPTGARANGQGGIFRTPGNNLPNLSGNNSTTGLPIYQGSVWSVDFFGRGLDDLAYTDGTKVYLQENGGSTLTPTFSQAETSWKDSTNNTFIDSPLEFDGSGRGGALAYFVTSHECIPDGCKPPPPTVGYQALQSSGTTAAPQYVGYGQISAMTISPEPIDALGSGLTDLLASNGNYLFEVNTNGNGFNTVSTGIADPQAVDDVIADFYGDGRQEALVDYPNPNTGFGLLRLNYSLASRSFVATVSDVSTALPPGYVKGSLRVGNIEANGLDDLIYSVQTTSGGTSVYTWHYRLHAGGAPDLVTSVTDGLGNVSQFTYASLASGAPVYTEGSNGSYPINDIQSPMQVVSSFSESDGIGGMFTLGYTYTGGQFDQNGLGFLGFQGRTITDSRFNTTETIAYSLTFPWTGMVTSDVVTNSTSGTLIRGVVNTHPDELSLASPYTTSYMPFFDSSVSTAYNANQVSQTIRTVTTKLNQSDFDGYGNLMSSTVTTVDGATGRQFTSVTTTAYASPDTATNCVGLPQQVTTQRTAPTGTLSRIASTPVADLDTVHCRLNSQTVASGESGDGTPALTKSYQYDGFGNVSQVQVSGPGLQTRTSQYSFQGGDGEFPISNTQIVSSTLSLANATSWNYALGLKGTDTDANGNITTYVYDGFGRLSKIKKPDGTKVVDTYAWCSAPTAGVTCPAGASYEVTATEVGSDGTSITTGYTAYDMKGRPVEQGTVLLGGVTSLVDTAYDDAGNTVSTTRPYFKGQATVYSTTYSYARAFNRLIKAVEPANAGDTASAGVVTTYGYDVVAGTGYAFTVTRTVGTVSHAVTTYSDALGEAIETVDANGGQATSSYDAFGDLLTSTAADGSKTSTTYDGLGHKISMTDPDLGQWSYQVDALGEVLCQTDADNQSVIMSYDGIGRILTKLATAPGAGCNATAGTSSAWTYDQAGALGLPASLSDSNGFERQYAYDALTRPTDVTTTVGGTAYTVSTGYDNFSRVQTISYPVSVAPNATGNAPTAVATATPAVTATGSSVTLDGSTSTDPSGLQLQYQWTQTGGPSLELGSFDPAAATTTFTPATAGVYGFQLQVIDSASSLSAPVAVSVTVKPVAPAAPTVWPNPSSSGGFVLTWKTIPEASSYNLYQSTDGVNFTQIQTLNAPVSGNVTAYLVSLANGTYYFAASTNANGVAGDMGAASQGVITLYPAASASVSTSGDPAHTGAYTVSWSAVPALPGISTITYHVMEATGTSSGPTSGYTEKTACRGTATSCALSHPGNSSYYYYYYVYASDVNGNGPNSPVTSIHLVVRPGVPGAFSPASQSNTTGNFTISWGTASGLVTYYQLFQDTSTSFSTETWDGNTSATSMAVSESATGVWYFRARACNSSDSTTVCSDWQSYATATYRVPIGGGGGGGCPPAPYQCQLVMSDDDVAATPATVGEHDAPVVDFGTGFDRAVALATRVEPDPSSQSMLPAERAPLQLPRAPASRQSAAVLAALAKERSDFISAAPLQPSETSLRQRSERLAEARIPAVLPIVEAGDPVLRRQLMRAASQGPLYAPPAYAAYAGARYQAAASTPYRFAVQYSYDPSSGALQAISDAGTGFIYWRAATTSGSTPVDPFGHLLAYVDGNNVSTVEVYDQATGHITGISAGVAQSSTIQQLAYTWDGFGNLQQRCDANRGLVENSTYDNLNRLKTSNANTGLSAGSCTGGTAATAIGVSYDAVGDIQTLTNSSNAAVGGTYTYDPNHTHAVSTASNLPGTYTYDANGNMLTGNGRTIVWSAENLPTSITGQNGSSSFVYGPDHQRYQQSAVDASGNTTATTYIGNIFEVVSTGSTVQYRHSITANGGVVAIHTIDQSGDVTTDYVHSDHLGSVDAITDSTSAVTQQMSFDAFGLRRDPGNWSYDLSAAQIASLKGVTDRGFTYQEQLDNVQLVHMNGRVYDPTIGRFISADPVVGGDRYGYVDDNPLSRADPSGYCWAGCFWQPNAPLKALNNMSNLEVFALTGWMPWDHAAINHSAYELEHNQKIQLVVAIALSVETGGASLAYFEAMGADAFWAGVAEGAVAGGTFSATMGTLNGESPRMVIDQTLRGAATGALSAGLLYGANSLTSAANNNFAVGLVSHGVAGGLASVASGGSFNKGFELGGLAYSSYTLYQHMVNGEAPSWSSGNGTQPKSPTFAASGESQVFNNFGAAVPLGGPVCALCEGSTFSNAMDAYPGMNALATLHDVWADELTDGLFSSSPALYYATFDVPTMLPAAALTYSALANTSIGYGIISSKEANGGH